MPGKVVSAIWGRRELSCGLALTCLDLSSPSHLLCRAPHLRPDPCRRSPISPFTEESAGPGPGPGELRRPCAPLSKSGPAASLLLGAGGDATRPGMQGDPVSSCPGVRFWTAPAVERRGSPRQPWGARLSFPPKCLGPTASPGPLEEALQSLRPES